MDRAKQKAVVFEPIRLPSCYNVKTLNDKVLRAQHYKLSEKFRVKVRLIAQLEKHIEELENRHSSDEQMLSSVNRQWNQLDDMLMDLLKKSCDSKAISDGTPSADDEDSRMTEVDEQVDSLEPALREEVESVLNENRRFETMFVQLATEKAKLVQKLKRTQASDSSAKASQKTDNVPEKQPTDENSAQVDELQHELEIQMELAEKRLTEIQNLTTANQELASKVVDLNNAIKFLPTSVISGSPDYICLSLKYNHLMDEARRVDAESNALKSHVLELRSCFDSQVTELKNEFLLAMERLRENCSLMSSELLAVKKECALMELEFKQKYEVDAIENKNSKIVKQLLSTAREDASRKAAENCRLRRDLENVKAELGRAKRANSAQAADEERPDEEWEERRRRILDRLKDLPAEALGEEVLRLHKEADRLKRELASYVQSEKGLMTEIENTAAAVDDLMAQNTQLADRIAEQEDTYVKMVKDGLQSEVSLRVLKQAIDVLEEKVKIVENEREAMRIELQQHLEKAELCKANAGALELNLKKVNAALEQARRNGANVQLELGEFKVRHEKQNAELQDLRQQLKEKSMNTEGSRTKIARLREERNVLKKKLHRAKQAADCENFDKLLMEENKVLRESLTCPSCKTGDKNTVLTKCFHVFCMDCIKKRYDGRSRKCPKCNAGFGANDFHRIYLE